jgi:predicted 2-oxoglutarate/Fe(II)-dependent dioxygenase YbiX
MLTTKANYSYGQMFVPNVFTTQECQYIIAEAKNLEDASKGFSDLSISNPNFLYQNFKTDFLSEIITKKLANFVDTFNRKYFNFIIDEISDFRVIALRQNEKIEEHVDLTGSVENSSRKITIIVNLSHENIFRGGNIQLKNLFDKVPNKTGGIVIFPSYIPYKIEEVVQGTKFMLILWAYGLSFR